MKRLKQSAVGLSFVAAAAVTLAVVSCGENPITGGGGCSSDATCAMDEICHPVSKQCIKTCTGTADCTSASLTCSSSGLSGSSKICQCSSDGMCGLSEVCQPWSVCTAKCTGSTDCPTGYSCNSTSGKCEQPVDAGTTCSASNSQPDTCGYGKVCGSSSACTDAPVGTCSNFGSSHSTSSWSASSGTGPVIYEHTDVSPDNAAACTAGTPFTVTLKAYAANGGTMPAMKSNLPGFKYVTTTGTEVDIPSTLLQQANYTVSSDMKNATMTFTLCSTTATSSIVAGFYFTGGNPYCATLSH